MPAACEEPEATNTARPDTDAQIAAVLLVAVWIVVPGVDVAAILIRFP